MKMFPIHSTSRKLHLELPEAIPWSIVEPHEVWALKNHGQSLQRLAERGGLAAGEIRCVVEHRDLFSIKHGGEYEQEHIEWLMKCLSENILSKEKEIRVGETTPTVYMHYKGGRYKVLFEGIIATNGPDEGKPVVIYVSMTNGKIFVRDFHEFHGVVNGTKRFEIY